jgi:hypothetical protein
LTKKNFDTGSLCVQSRLTSHSQSSCLNSQMLTSQSCATTSTSKIILTDFPLLVWGFL